MNRLFLLVVFVFGLLIFVTGVVDLDWMVVAPRFNTWYFSVDYWEFAPYFKMNWHLAYVFTVVRSHVGAGLIGALLTYLMLNVKEVNVDG